MAYKHITVSLEVYDELKKMKSDKSFDSYLRELIDMPQKEGPKYSSCIKPKFKPFFDTFEVGTTGSIGWQKSLTNQTGSTQVYARRALVRYQRKTGKEFQITGYYGDGMHIIRTK